MPGEEPDAPTVGVGRTDTSKLPFDRHLPAVESTAFLKLNSLTIERRKEGKKTLHGKNKQNTKPA